MASTAAASLSLALLAVLILSTAPPATCSVSSPDNFTDTILPGQALLDASGETLVSPSRVFQLGFVDLDVDLRYAGIWYYVNNGMKIIFWVANRDDPLADHSGEVALDSAGDLVIGPVTVARATGGGMKASLRDSGELVVEPAGGGAAVWSSFDNPGDTWIPGMKLTASRTVRSWRTGSNPAAGSYSFGPDGSPGRFAIRSNGTVTWNGTFTDFAGAPSGASLTLDGDAAAGGVSFSFVPGEDYSLVRFLLFSTGHLTQFFFADAVGEWVYYRTSPETSCGEHNQCGPFGVCDGAACRCPEGFRRLPAGDSNSGGCVRENKLSCGAGAGDGFVPMPRMRLPGAPQSVAGAGAGVDGCRNACAATCSCSGFAVVSGAGCNIWVRNFSNELYQFPNDSGAGGGAQAVTLYIRVGALTPSPASSRDQRSKIWVLAIALPAAFVIALGCCCFFIRRRRRRRSKPRDVEQVKVVKTSDETKSSDEVILESVHSDYTVFQYSQIAAITDNFSEENILGRGGFGPVYKGHVEGYGDIAVKRLAINSGQGMEEFKNEISALVKLRHTNLVRILGYCVDGVEKMLIYEFMANKSLDFFIFDKARSGLLNWEMRFHIIEGIAQGLNYLHRHSRLRVIHRDLKPSNILLDEHMNPKISDFGLARIFGSTDTHANTRRIVGTYGYMSPEYAIDGTFSVKSDVYSFGVLLLEILSGMRNNGSTPPGEADNLLNYAYDLWESGRSPELVDRSVGGGFDEGKMVRCLHVALLCVQERPADRPTSSEAIAMFENQGMVLPSPKPPTFQSFSGEVDDARSQTFNNLTISRLAPR